LDLDAVEGYGGAESEVEAGVAGGEIAAPGADFIGLCDVAGGDGNARANGHAITLCADEVERDPVVIVFGFVEEERGWGADVEDKDVESAVVTDIAECCAAAGLWGACVQAGFGGDLAECAVCLIEE
jgi:hypothetical protein